MDRLQGIVAVWLHDRGFGFIVTEGHNVQKFFFHFSRVTKGAGSLAVGAKVVFSINPIRDGKNLSAVDIEVLDSVATPLTEGVAQ
jgi:cold shock CspA family protein